MTSYNGKTGFEKFHVQESLKVLRYLYVYRRDRLIPFTGIRVTCVGCKREEILHKDL